MAKTIDKIITQVNGQYGAPLGRPNIGSRPGKSEGIRIYDCKVPMDSLGEYDKGGAYWGIDTELRVSYTKDLKYVEFYRVKNKQDIPKDNDVYSRIVKFLLATNYYYTIIDEVKETEYYRQKLKSLINQVEKELDAIHKCKDLKLFYEMADEKLHLNNLDLHTMFFNKICRMSSSMLEAFMIEFLEKHSLPDE